MARHEWRDRTEDGELIYHRATQHAGTWRFQSQRKSEDQWTYFDPPEYPLDSLKSFREVLMAKHTRRRVHQDHVDQIDKIIVQREATERAKAKNRAGDEDE